MAKNYVIIHMILFLVFLNALTFASEPPGLNKQNKTPPGFSQGKKKGWSGSNPPGWNKSNAYNKKNKINEDNLKGLEFDCDSLTEGEYDERCTNLKKKGKTVIKPGQIKKNIDKN